MVTKFALVFAACQVVLCFGDIIPGLDASLSHVGEGIITDPGYIGGDDAHLGGATYIDEAHGHDASLIGGGVIPAEGSNPIEATAAPAEAHENPQSCTCITHKLESNVRPVVDECVRHVPVVRKKIRYQEEQFTRHVPVVEKIVTQQEEKHIRHVPVTQKFTRPVIETRTRHVPVTKTRTRTVVEPYTTHVPVTEKFQRAVEESVTRNVPVVERRVKPVVHKHIRHVPITEKRTRPIVESHVVNVPVRQRIVKNLVEQRVRPVVGPCSPCIAEPFPASVISEHEPSPCSVIPPPTSSYPLH